MLLLRKEAQELLDAVGLSDLHTTIKNKSLALVGECGKHFIQINGITFTKSTINRAERKYAIELFTKFLDKYKSKIKEFVEARKEHNKLTNPDFKALGYEVNGGDIILRLENIEVCASNYTKRCIITADDITIIPEALRTHEAEVKKLLLHVDEVLNFRESKNKLDKLKNKIAICNI